MSDFPSPAAKHPVPRPRRDDLSQFPCGFDRDDFMGDPKPCGGECPAVEFSRPCPFLLLYRKALAYKRCARLLRVALWAWTRPLSTWARVDKFVDAIRSALLKAGLL